VQATSDIPVEGHVITRTTGTTQNTDSGGSGNASKTWASAKITIESSATNEVGQPHTFTVTIYENNGGGYQHVGAGEDCEITLTGGGTPGAVPSPPGPFNLMTSSSGQCSTTFTSQTAGTVIGHGKSMLVIGGQPVTIETDGSGANSGNATKTF